MPWISPKTDWAPGDGIMAGDLNRIEGNIDWLNKISVVYGNGILHSTAPVDVPVHREMVIMPPKSELRVIAFGYMIDGLHLGSYLGGAIAVRVASASGINNPVTLLTSNATYTPPVLTDIIMYYSPRIVMSNPLATMHLDELTVRLSPRYQNDMDGQGTFTGYYKTIGNYSIVIHYTIKSEGN
jgi:hypothetical protein